MPRLERKARVRAIGVTVKSAMWPAIDAPIELVATCDSLGKKLSRRRRTSMKPSGSSSTRS